jgi:hypothetical protein
MNFLVGHNGSELLTRDLLRSWTFTLMTGGKSALLSAITIAMGGKAAITGRGNGLKDLIRKGCE